MTIEIGWVPLDFGLEATSKTLVSIGPSAHLVPSNTQLLNSEASSQALKKKHTGVVQNTDQAASASTPPFVVDVPDPPVSPLSPRCLPEP